ncbi:MAG: response regulator [Polyangiaceae bacterium]|nr:response regulator [Polyangiaceae bacterium]
MKKIIIVDDSRTARIQVKNTLGCAGFEVVEAIDGKDGIAQIEAHDDASLVLCDVNMPNLNGLDMLDALPEKTRSKMIFLMLTTEAEPRLVQRAKNLGAKGWIVKPFKPELLVAAVKKLAG